MLAQAAGNQFYGILISAAAILLVIGAIAVLANYVRKMAMEKEQDRTGLGLSIDQIEQMHSQGQISEAEYKLLRRLALGKMLPPETAKPAGQEGTVSAKPVAGEELPDGERDPKKLTPAMEAFLAKVDARQEGQKDKRADAKLRRRVFWLIWLLLLLGAVLTFAWKSLLNRPDSVGPVPPGPLGMPGRYVGFPPTTASHPGPYPAYPTTGPFPGSLPPPTSEPVLEKPQTQPAAQQ